MTEQDPAREPHWDSADRLDTGDGAFRPYPPTASYEAPPPPDYRPPPTPLQGGFSFGEGGRPVGGQPGPPPTEFVQPGYPPSGHTQPGYPPGGYGPPGYPPSGYGWPGYPGSYPAGYPGQSWGPRGPTNGLAVASMVLGILWVYGLGSILALIFGYVARKQIRERGESGNGMAIAGIALGWVGVGITIIVLVVLMIGAASQSTS
ncbi:MAG: DUF4190 domain-containing protein [Pseudonocardia sp.]|nr:DUF4190 domain-containing protein [Pseudonocardia sp.]